MHYRSEASRAPSGASARLAYILKDDPLVPEANAIQAMRMIDAFAGLTPHMLLPVPVRWSNRLFLRPAHLQACLRQHFGLAHQFRIVPIAATSLLRPGGRPRPRLFHRRTIRYLARQCRPDLIITRSERVVRLCSDYSLPVVFETHAGPDETRRLATFGALCTDSAVVGVVTIHERLAQLYAEHGVPSNKIVVLPDGVSRASLTRRRLEPTEARIQLGLDPERAIVLYTGSLQSQKGVTTLIAAARRLPEVIFVLVGRAVEPIAALAGDGPVPRNCLQLGYRPPAVLSAFLDAADICVLPNTLEHPSAEYTSPLKLFEYMASGKPIVASNIPALIGILEDGQNARLFQPNDDQGLAREICTLLTHPSLRHRIAVNARSKVASFTWERRAEKIVESFLKSARS